MKVPCISIALVAAVLAVALAGPSWALPQRYQVPPTLDLQLLVDPEPGTPGTWTLTGKVKALAAELPGSVVSFRLPPEVEPVGPVPKREETLRPGQELSLSLKVKLKPDQEHAVVGFGASYAFPHTYWMKYVREHEKAYPRMLLRDLLYAELEAQGGKRTAQAKVATLTRGGR